MKRWLIIIPFFLIFTQVFGQPQPPLHIGFMGDSSMDEYRGTDNRGNTGGFAPTTLNWIEQLVMHRNIDAGVWGNYPSPRRTGYEYNWALSAANSTTLLSSGQHTGLAAQVAAGKIDLVIVCIGGNDFAPWAGGAYSAIYNGTLSGTNLQNKINQVVVNITTAVDTILAARTIPMIITTVGDFELSPQIRNSSQFSDPVKRQRVSAAIQKVNDGILAMVEARHLTLFDISAFNLTFLTQVSGDFLVIDGVPINMKTAGNEPHNLLLDDAIHGGTVLEGLIANGYLDRINTLVQPDIPLFSNSEILEDAGLHSIATPTPSFTPTPTSLPNAAPVLNYQTAQTAVLTWGPVDGAEQYTLQISRNANFTDLIPVNNPLSATTLSYTTLTLDYGTYYWRVRGVRGDGIAGGWSLPEQFTIAYVPPTRPSSNSVSSAQISPTLTAMPTLSPSLTPTPTITPLTR